MPEPATSAFSSAAGSAAGASDELTIEISLSEHGLDSATVTRLALGEHELRRELANGVQRVFLIGNIALWVLVLVLVLIDVVLVAVGLEAPSDRIVDGSVVKTLIGATVVQVGLIMLAISRHLFPPGAGGESSWWRKGR